MNLDKISNNLVIKQVINNRFSPFNKPTIKQIDQVVKTLNKPYPMKSIYKNIIPLNIFQTWYTKILPKKMDDCVNKIKTSNPAFNHYLYDDNECREFIKNNYDIEILNSYDSLIPGAYKADLWRYCILYKLGGIYLDVKYKPVKGFKFINLTEKQHFVIDRDNIGIYNALMVSLPNNPFLLKAIKAIVFNVKHRYYGSNNLEPTGPYLLSKIIPKNDKSVDMKHDFFINMDNRYITYNNYIILKSYNGYMAESSNMNKQHYSILWNNKNIYK